MAEFITYGEDSEYWKQKQERERRAELEKNLPKCEGLAFWVPPCTDVFIGNTAYVWYRLLQFTGDCDLDIERYCGDVIGESQTWFEEYEDVSNIWYEMTGSRIDGTRGLSFALEEGIAPGQPFLIEYGEPRWYKCSYEYNEWDVEHDFEIVRTLPRDPVKAANSFERAFTRKKRHDERRARYRSKLDALQRTDVKAMYLEQDLYYVQSYPSDMDAPTGKRLSLCTTHTKLPSGQKTPWWGRRDFFSGEDPDSWDVALEKLFVKANEQLGLTREQFNQLPKKWRR